MSTSRAVELSGWRQAAQETTSVATNYGAPWSAADDHHLVHGDGTVLERAVHLDRTYYACAARLAYLRSQGVDTD